MNGFLVFIEKNMDINFNILLNIVINVMLNCISFIFTRVNII